MKSTDIRRWTEHEDELLRAAIGKFGRPSEGEALDSVIISSSLTYGQMAMLIGMMSLQVFKIAIIKTVENAGCIPWRLR